MPPKRGRGQGGRGRGRGSPRAKAPAVAASPAKPDLETAVAAEERVEDPLSQGAVVEDPPSQDTEEICGDVAQAERSQEGEATTISEECKAPDEATGQVNLPMDLEQADGENNEASVSEEPNTSEVVDSELAENEISQQQNESALSLDVEQSATEPEEMEVSDAGGQAQVASTENLIVINDGPDDVIIIDDEQDKVTVAEKMNEADNSRSFWNLRVCPMPFQAIVQNRGLFVKIMAKCLNFELRMSQHLHNKAMREVGTKEDDADGAPWVPVETLFDKWQAATAGLLEFKLVEIAVPVVVDLISKFDLKRNDRIRFELTKITKEEALKSPFKSEEELKKEAEEKKNKEKNDRDSKDFLQVNFGKRFTHMPLKEVFLKHPDDHVKTEEDDYIFLSNIPDELPDSILVAIMNTEMKERKLGENSTGTATFKVPENMAAEDYMERYDGILVNSKLIEMATTLGTFSDMRRLRSEIILNRREETRKRKLEEKSTGVPAAKRQRSRWGPQVNVNANKPPGNANKPPGNANKKGGRGKQPPGFAGRGRGNQGFAGRGRGNQGFAGRGRGNQGFAGRGRGNQVLAGRGQGNQGYVRRVQGNAGKQKPGFNPMQRGGKMPGRGNYFQKQHQQNMQAGFPGHRNPQNVMGRPGQRPPNQPYQGQNNNRGRGHMHPQPLMGIGFGMERAEAEQNQIHMMADLQAKLLEKQRELDFLQNQARLQMAMIEEREMAAAARHSQRQMQLSPGGQSGYHNWQPNPSPSRQQFRQQNRQHNNRR